MLWTGFFASAVPSSSSQCEAAPAPGVQPTPTTDTSEPSAALLQRDPLVEVSVQAANDSRRHAVSYHANLVCYCCCCIFASQLFCFFRPPVCLYCPFNLWQARFFPSVCLLVVLVCSRYPLMHSIVYRADVAVSKLLYISNFESLTRRQTL